MWPLDKLLIHKNEHWRIFGSRSTDLPNISQSLNKVILDSARAKHLFFNFISQTHHHVLEGYLNIVYQVLVLWHGFMANALHRWEHSLEKWLEIVPCTTKNNIQKCVIFRWEKKSLSCLLLFYYYYNFFFKVNIDFYYQHKSGQFYLWTIILKSVPQKKKNFLMTWNIVHESNWLLLLCFPCCFAVFFIYYCNLYIFCLLLLFVVKYFGVKYII